MHIKGRFIGARRVNAFAGRAVGYLPWSEKGLARQKWRSHLYRKGVENLSNIGDVTILMYGTEATSSPREGDGVPGHREGTDLSDASDLTQKNVDIIMKIV
jgi:hypothetical protein